MSVFSERLAALRQRVFGSKAKLAKVTGFSASAISLWESGKRVPNVETAVKLANALGVSADYLLGKTSDPLPYSEAIAEVTAIPTWTTGVEVSATARAATEPKNGQHPGDSEKTPDQSPKKSAPDFDLLLAAIHDLRKADPNFQTCVNAQVQRKGFNVSLYASAYDNASQFASEATENEIKAARDLLKMAVESLENALEKKRATDPDEPAD